MEVHFYMAKLTRKQKIEIYEKRKEGYLFHNYQSNIVLVIL